MGLDGLAGVIDQGRATCSPLTVMSYFLDPGQGEQRSLADYDAALGIDLGEGGLVS